jgi:hypothetical protein
MGAAKKISRHIHPKILLATAAFVSNSILMNAPHGFGSARKFSY